MIEMEVTKFTKDEVVDVISKYTKTQAEKVRIILELLIKLGVVSEYVFKGET